MSNARVRMPPDLDEIHLFQLEDCIIQPNLGEQDRDMARMYLIDRIPQVEIAADFGCSRTTNQRLYKRMG